MAKFKPVKSWYVPHRNQTLIPKLSNEIDMLKYSLLCKIKRMEQDRKKDLHNNE